MSGTPSIDCIWCGKKGRQPSGWEQLRTRDRGYAPLCKPCARRRLGNPWNALLGLRKVEA